MTSNDSLLTVAIDTTADIAGVALFGGDALVSELTWYSRQSHSRDLLPSLDWLLHRAHRDKSEVNAIAVCLGPGSYAGMRVGVSTAKALAYGLGAALIGVGRLEADALPFAAATAGRVVPIHAAGRAELAWAAYEADEAGVLRETTAPHLTPLPELPDLLQPDDIVVAALASLPAALTAALQERGIRLVEASPARVISVARLGIGKLASGVRDDPDSLAPMYLRAPAIGPQG